MYLGTKQQLNESIEKNCSVCNLEISTKTKYKKNYFVSISVGPQIKRLIEDNINDFSLDNPASLENIYDIYDGKTYQEIKQQLNDKEFITLTSNTDGAPVYKKARNTSLWPLQHFINEFRLKGRFKREKMFCSGFWYGRTPDMSCFLKPLIDELNEINENGGLSIKINNCEKKVLIIPLLFTLDSIAKCLLTKQVQFNGYNGCPVCEHPGTLINNQIRYCNEDNAPERSNIDVIESMRLAYESGIIQNGFKGLSPLLGISAIRFNFIWQIVIDKLHNIDLGAYIKLLDLWLSSKNKRGVR